VSFGHASAASIDTPARLSKGQGNETLLRNPSPSPQKRCPTAFHLFPNAREVVLEALVRPHLAGGVAAASSLEAPMQRVEVLDALRLPVAPAEAAAARAALAGVTRLEVCNGHLERTMLAAALLCLPGLREVSLLDCVLWWEGELRTVDQAGSDLVAALSWCPRLESLE
jgi:hypothetical protein